MPESDPLRILLAHDRWATVQILEACSRLTREQFHQRFDIGPGSLHDTVTHIIAAMHAWTETLAGAEPRPRIDADGQQRTPQELLGLLEASCRELAGEADRRPVSELVTRRTRDGRTIQVTRGVVLTQITTHGMHHRAQCLNMLRQLGVRPLPESSVVEWTWLGEMRG